MKEKDTNKLVNKWHEDFLSDGDEEEEKGAVYEFIGWLYTNKYKIVKIKED